MAPRILFFGTGAVGAGYLWILSRKVPAENLVAVCRSNFDAASQHGFRMNSTLWGEFTYRPAVVRSVDEAAALDPLYPFDYVIIASKAIPSSPSTAQLIRPAIAKGTSIVLFQNGIAIEEEYSKLYPKNPVLSTVVYFPATQTSPAVINHTELETLLIGTYPADAPAWHAEAARNLVQLVIDCGATAKHHDDVQPQRWSKLLINASLNPICALSRSRDLQFLESGHEAQEVMRDLMAEIVAVAQAYGYSNLSQASVDNGIERVKNRKPPGVEPSMQTDAQAGRNMEVDAILGNLLRLAREKGVNVPILRTTYAYLKALDASFTRSRQGGNFS
ncbi:hypothetical protein LTR70_007070 [Exophiala xenobiotica]|uniref:2-dehydropantoate 2-reductase n=1 Tax=Lithohypha guttulata TaxID=1690604 RepID=A0ABR0K6W5_9EURO|nr:hypothetical protein LTR24_006295 [Lithohypha guttulata]KAK5314633.1 hypothetical protein LTR70_007070 [Exophiala xenobiotica]